MSLAIVLPREIGAGKAREVRTVFADPWRKLVLIRLRNGARLAEHSARVPIIIHALTGQGSLTVAGADYALCPGVLVPVNADVKHSVQAEPELAILVTFFRQPGTEAEGQTPVRFD